MQPLSKFIVSVALGLSAGIGIASYAQVLPPEVDAILARAKLPKEALSLYAVEVPNGGVAHAPLLNHRAQVAVNPASVMKLVTSYAALDLLGANYTWTTQVFSDGVIKDGVLHGNLYIKGGGDPKLVVERLWLLLRRVQSMGIKSIQGDIVLDHSAFNVADKSPAAFDGEAQRPYNASPDALLINFKSLVLTFTPNIAQGVATLQMDPPMYQVDLPASVPLQAGDCNDYRAALKADFSNPNRLKFSGGYAKICGEKTWPIAYVEPASYATRAVRGMWEALGGKLSGQARDGHVPAALKAWFELPSPPLAQVMVDMNKFSNNVMAQQIFLSLSLDKAGGNQPASVEASRSAVQAWWRNKLGNEAAPVLDNGSGLSRDERISAQALAHLLQQVYASSFMPELMSSLPVTGVDGTLRKRGTQAGMAHLKTGSLRDVVALAGYVDGQRDSSAGKRYVLVAIVNSNDASVIARSRPALDAVMEWLAYQ